MLDLQALHDGMSLFVQGLTMGPLLGRLGLLAGKQRHDAYERARATSIMVAP